MRYFALESNGGGWFKKLYAGKKASEAQRIVNNMRRYSGWTAPWPEPGSVGIVRAATFKEAVEIAGQKLEGRS